MNPSSSPDKNFYNVAFNLTVLVAGLGYFVDTFDFFLYNSMRVPSLMDLGLSGDEATRIGLIILNCQIFGALIGSFFWGILGDKVGRKSSLFASILIYSLAMSANSIVQGPLLYGFLRFIIGFGVAGEVGLGVTLIAETIRSSKRTYALMFFTMMGVLGVVIAGVSLEFVSWRISCLAGGILGFVLLLLRATLFESQLFIETSHMGITRGSLRELFGKPKNITKFFSCIFILGANFFVTGILMTLAPEIAKANGTQGVVQANIALALYFSVAIFGDGLSALLSEIFKSRRFVASLFIIGNMSLTYFFLQKVNLTVFQFYTLCAVFGIFNLWAICGTIVVEQFPTTIRATAATSSYSSARATVILMNQAFLALKPLMGPLPGLVIIGSIIFTLGLIAVWLQQESYGRPLANR